MCPVSAISGYTPVNYLISDSKNLYFVNILSASSMVNKTPFVSNSYLLEEIDLSKPQAMLTPQVSGGVAMEINDTQLYSNGTTLYFINSDEESVTLI